MNATELNQVFKEHLLWVKSKEEKGKKAVFQREKIANADFSKKNLSNANFFGAEIYWSKFNGAKLFCADFRRAKLTGANFTNADLSEADFTQAILHEVNFFGAILNNTSMAGADIAGAKNIFTFNKAGGRICYAVRWKKCLMVKSGCFWGTLHDFEAQCQRAYPYNKTEGYRPQIDYLKNLQEALC